VTSVLQVLEQFVLLVGLLLLWAVVGLPPAVLEPTVSAAVVQAA
jgi:hypothetical protein